MSVTSDGADRSELIDVIDKLSDLQLMIVQQVRKLRRLRRLERRVLRRMGPAISPGLTQRLEYLEEAIPLRRNEFVAAILNSDERELGLLASHQLLNDSDDWPVKYAAFIAAYVHALDTIEVGGQGIWPDSRLLDEIDSATPALAVGNAIVGSAVHAIPLAGGVYKEIKDNIEGIVNLVKRIPGAAAEAGRAAVGGAKKAARRVKKIITRDHPPEAVPAGGGQAEEGPAPLGAP
jgi:hypothetical protein